MGQWSHSESEVHSSNPRNTFTQALGPKSPYKGPGDFEVKLSKPHDS